MKRLAIILLHAAYWMMYLLLLFLFLFMSWLQSRHILHGSAWHAILYWPGLIMLLFMPAVSFYIFYTVLFARFLPTKRLFLLFISGITVSAGAALLGILINSLLFAPQFGLHLSFDTGMLLLVMSGICFVHGVLAFVIKGFIGWYEDIRLKEALNRKNYEMELDLIKSQLNPHFLFNTLNNIDVLIQKDADLASVYLNQLSDILRFVLYEAKTPQIPITQELQYIDKYIQLQKIRTTHPEYISYTVEGKTGDRLVEPMLFIPLIENAFKHAEKKIQNAISIQFTFTENEIIFVCANKYNKTLSPGGGLGDSLIRRRLSLLYPGRHRLDISTIDNTYKAILTLTYAN